ncbi:putative RNA-directed DNA polymerase from transposon BS [Trichonephila clavipes]|nr:putative RNA-directed DNA polymerase from transposon BS [Trichonephila clavipes]
MINNFFTPELNNHDVQELWFQQDGATCHAARATIDLLKDTKSQVINNIESQVAKGRITLNLLKFISGRDWGADANTLRTTYISLIRSILEYGLPVYACAFKPNLDQLKRVQLSAGRVISGLRPSCPNDIVLFESNFLPLSFKRSYCLSKCYNKLSSFGDQHRTSAYFRDWDRQPTSEEILPIFSCKDAGFVFG